MALKLAIPLPGPFVWLPGWPKVEQGEKSTGLTGFILVVLPVWLVFASLWCLYAVIWLAVWLVVITARAIAELFSPRRGEHEHERSDRR